MSQKTPKTITFYLLIIALAGSGAWGISLIFSETQNTTLAFRPALQDQINVQKTKESQLTQRNVPLAKEAQNQHKEPTFNDLMSKLASHPTEARPTTHALNEQLKLVETMLTESRYNELSHHINDHYSLFSSQDLTQVRLLYQMRAHALSRKGASGDLVALYRSEASIFNDLTAWLNLSRIAIQTQKWQTAFDATLQASLQENDGVKLQKQLKRLFRVTANLRASLEKQGDKLGVHELYSALYKAHPGYPRFQLELAYSYLRLNQPDDARPLLQPLQFDIELGKISRDVLTRLNQSNTESVAALSPEPSNPDIEVPLQRQGTNLIANLNINNRNVPLLLDTGASITALDNRLIDQLGLPATGQVIQLSTANGVRSARLYRANRLQLGRFRLKNHIIAGIDLGRSSAFSGLLGTDLLNGLSENHSFLIDNNKSALIFRPK